MGVMTMTNLTIDTTVLMLPTKANNLKRFLKGNIAFLRTLEKDELEKYESVTVNYMNHIPGNLGFMVKGTDKKGDEKYTVDIAKIRLKLLKLDTTGEFGYRNPLIEYYIGKLIAICPKPLNPKKKNLKGRLGIYGNIPGRHRDPDEEFRALDMDPGIYPNRGPVLFDVFRNYLGYLAYLNDKYVSDTENYMVLGAEKRNMDVQPVKVKTAKENREASVNIVGIGKALGVCRHTEGKKFESLIPVLEEAKKRFCNQLAFGQGVHHSSVTEGLKLTEEESKKVFLYLKTFNEVVKLINERNLNTENIIEMLNAHGLLCSPEDEKTMEYGYRKYKCAQRTLDNGMGETILFDFHLKPLTKNKFPDQPYNKSKNPSDPEHTVRVYFVWNDESKKIGIGWMGHHLPECAKKNDDDDAYTESDCPYTDCPNNPLSPSYKKPLTFPVKPPII
jgi:hypothetical protein